jgi:hypothetical protein
MGRKGVSKRKSPKPKTEVVSSATNTVSGLAHASASPKPVTLNKGDAISISIGGKKKSSDDRLKNKKR